MNEKVKTALVPTMGALHEGHISLGKIARQHAEKVVYSIFVNPTQFGAGEDFDKYPRNIEADKKKLQGIADEIFIPSVDEIYPNGLEISCKAGENAKGLDGDFRPQHFDGVVTVVSRLFELIKPDIAIFGEKDYQQLMVIREIFSQKAESSKLQAEKKSSPLTAHCSPTIIGAPIMREADGLAMSSRNVYLSEDERLIAPKLYEVISSGITIPEMDARLRVLGFRIDYIAKRWNRILVAAWLGKTRLIDNIAIS